jgi:hypothetical protein
VKPAVGKLYLRIIDMLQLNTFLLPTITKKRERERERERLNIKECYFNSSKWSYTIKIGSQGINLPNKEKGRKKKMEKSVKKLS